MRFSVRLMTLVIALVGLAAPAAHATRYYVDVDALAGGTGLTWGAAFNNLQQGLAAASADPAIPHEIWVAEGTYDPLTGAPLVADPRDASFHMLDDTAVYGGFAGVETSIKQRDIQAHVVVLTGDIGVPGDVSDNSYHVVQAMSVGAGSKLDGVTITKGAGSQGSGMLVNASAIRIVRCTFEGNSAGSVGAALRIDDEFEGETPPALINCTIRNNVTGYRGALYVAYSDALISGCLFHDNVAGNNGGAMVIENCRPYLVNSTFAYNSVSIGAGGLAVFGGVQFVILNSIFWGNFNNQGTSFESQIWQPGVSHRVHYNDIQGLHAQLHGTGNINADPLFVSVAGDNYRLAAGSPCIDSANRYYIPADEGDLDHDGDVSELQPYDLDDLKRVVGITVDMGAYERQH